MYRKHSRSKINKYEPLCEPTNKTTSGKPAIPSKGAAVLQFPPRESRSTEVIIEFLGVCQFTRRRGRADRIKRERERELRIMSIQISSPVKVLYGTWDRAPVDRSWSATMTCVRLRKQGTLTDCMSPAVARNSRTHRSRNRWKMLASFGSALRRCVALSLLWFQLSVGMLNLYSSLITDRMFV